MDTIIGLLAALGAICILKEVYAIIMINCVNDESKIKLIIRGDGLKSEIILRKALLIRRKYFDKMQIIFVEENISEPEAVKQMARKYHIIYMSGKEQK